jgi:predicted transcriptional regulator
MSQSHQLSEVQLAFMRVLWDRGPSTVADVHAELATSRDLAPTTVATVLSRLEKRGLITHRTSGRQFIYRAVVSEQQVRRSMLSRVVEYLFEGDVTAVLSHLLSAREIDAEDLAEIKALIAEKERKSRTHDDG